MTGEERPALAWSGATCFLRAWGHILGSPAPDRLNIALPEVELLTEEKQATRVHVAQAHQRYPLLHKLPEAACCLRERALSRGVRPVNAICMATASALATIQFSVSVTCFTAAQTTSRNPPPKALASGRAAGYAVSFNEGVAGATHSWARDEVRQKEGFGSRTRSHLKCTCIPATFVHLCHRPPKTDPPDSRFHQPSFQARWRGTDVQSLASPLLGG